MTHTYTYKRIQLYEASAKGNIAEVRQVLAFASGLGDSILSSSTASTKYSLSLSLSLSVRAHVRDVRVTFKGVHTADVNKANNDVYIFEPNKHFVGRRAM